MSADEEDLSGQVLHHKYRLERRLGAGAFGAVYEATHLMAKATRAVKVIHAHKLTDAVACRMFLKEAQAVMRFSTPRAVVVHDVDQEEGGRLYIVMEMLRGETLRDYLRREMTPGRGLPLAEAIRIASQVCEALRAAHAAGVVHRDLKPSNVMMVPGESGLPDVKVVDFGIARLHSVTGTGETSTEIWVGSVGTPPYMSPEQVRGEDVDGRSDLYSLGVMLYEMLGGRLPFESKTPQGYAVAHLTETPLPLATVCPHAGVLPEVDRLVMQLLAKKREDRPRDAAEVLERLQGMAGARGAPSPLEVATPRVASRRVWPIAVAAVAALAVAAGWFAWSSRAPEAPQPPKPAATGARAVVESAPPPPVAVPPQAPDAMTTPDVQLTVAPPPPPPPPPAQTPRPPETRAKPAKKEARAPTPEPLATPPPVDRPRETPTTTPSPGPATVAPAPSPPPERATPARTPATERTPPVRKGGSDPWDRAFDELDQETRRYRR